MEQRPYFLAGDVLASTAVGVSTGSAIAWLFEPAWPVLPRMIAGMVLGMALALILALAVFAPLFGALEIYVPTMLTGMVTGMSVGMWPASVAVAAARGAVIGIACLSFVYAANWMLTQRGPRHV